MIRKLTPRVAFVVKDLALHPLKEPKHVRTVHQIEVLVPALARHSCRAIISSASAERFASYNTRKRKAGLIVIAQAGRGTPEDRDNGPKPLIRLLTGILKWLIGCAAVALLLAAALPTILSTGPGLQVGTVVASKFLPGTVRVEQAELGWHKPVKLSGVELRSPASVGGETLVRIQFLGTDKSLWDVVRGKNFDAFAAKPWVDCTLAPSGQLKWAQLVDHAAGKAIEPRGASLSSREGLASENAALVTETAEVPFTAEGRVLAGSLYVSDGTLKVPAEIRQVVGRDLHIAAAIGKANLAEVSEELSLDTEWASSSSISSSRNHGSATESDLSSKEEQQAKLREISQLQPAMLAIRSEHLELEASGWHQKDGRLLLRQPVQAQFTFTPALAKYGLVRVSPLLSGILAVEEGLVKVSVTAPDMIIPAESYQMKIDPLRVAVNRQDLLAKAIEFLRLKEGKQVEQKSLLQGATSVINVDFNERGVVNTRRLDLLISAGGKSKGVHLCTWGKIDPVTSTMYVALGVPADTLSMIGLKGLAENEMLVVPVKGTPSSPQVNWVEAYKRVASLAASHTSKQPKGLGQTILQGIVQGLDLRANAPGLSQQWEVPEAPEALPWEANSRLLQTAVKVDGTTVKENIV